MAKKIRAFREIVFLDGPREGNPMSIGGSQTAYFNLEERVRVPWKNPETGLMEYLIYERCGLSTNEYKLVSK